MTVEGSSAKLGAWVFDPKSKRKLVKSYKKGTDTLILSATRVTLVSMWRIDGTIVREASGP